MLRATGPESRAKIFLFQLAQYNDIETRTVAGRLKDQVAVITGGARGIGASFCEILASEGAKVVIADVLEGHSVARRISDHGGIASFQKADVTSSSSVKELAGVVLAEFGRVDVLVNNAALFANLRKKPFQQIEADEWDKVMAVNVRGPFECAKAFVPAMIDAKKGKIINVASGTVFKGFANMLHYVTSKGAVVAMTRCLARELGPHNICVNAIAPGLTMSEAVAASEEWAGKAGANTVASRAIQREQLPEDLVGTLVYLASDDSNFVTGQTITVDGGSVMR